MVSSDSGQSRIGWERHTGVVADHGPFTRAIVAVAQHAKVNAAVGGEWDALNDRRRQRREQQQAKGDEE